MNPCLAFGGLVSLSVTLRGLPAALADAHTVALMPCVSLPVTCSQATTAAVFTHTSTHRHMHVHTYRPFHLLLLPAGCWPPVVGKCAVCVCLAGFNVAMGVVDGLWAGGTDLATDFGKIAYQLKLLGYNAIRLPYTHRNLASTQVRPAGPLQQ